MHSCLLCFILCPPREENHQCGVSLMMDKESKVLEACFELFCTLVVLILGHVMAVLHLTSPCQVIFRTGCL